MKKTVYQKGFSVLHSDAMYDRVGRVRKANKAIAVLGDYLGNLKSLSLLDIGCSTGIVTRRFSQKFGKVVGIDIDGPAIKHAKRQNVSSNARYLVKDGMNTSFKGGSFDVIICAHVYEHVPDYDQLMQEIYRLLKVGGVCYFAAGNRITFIESHYRLPLLSLVPKALAHTYLRIMRRGNLYYENLLTYWGLRKLVSKFKIIDYTDKILINPNKYCATDLVSPGSIKQEVALLVCRIAYWVCPTYIWLLQKEK